MKWRVPPTQGPSRVPDFTAGSLEMSAFLIFARPRGESVSPAMSGTTFDRSRILPFLSMMPGFSRPGAPKRTSFMFPPDGCDRFGLSGWIGSDDDYASAAQPEQDIRLANLASIVQAFCGDVDGAEAAQGLW